MTKLFYKLVIVTGCFLATSIFAEDILYIGDSLSAKSTGFSKEVVRVLENKVPKNRVMVHALAGSSPSTWLSEQASRRTMKYGYKFQDLNGNVKLTNYGTNKTAPYLPDLLKNSESISSVVIQQGTNLLTGKTFSEKMLEKNIENLLNVVKGDKNRSVLWIGPPYARSSKTYKFINNARVDTFYKVLNALVVKHNKTLPKDKHIQVVDSRKDANGADNYYPKGSGDGVHFYSKEGIETEKKWIASAVGQMKNFPPSKATESKSDLLHN